MEVGEQSGVRTGAGSAPPTACQRPHGAEDGAEWLWEIVPPAGAVGKEGWVLEPGLVLQPPTPIADTVDCLEFISGEDGMDGVIGVGHVWTSRSSKYPCLFI